MVCGLWFVVCGALSVRSSSDSPGGSPSPSPWDTALFLNPETLGEPSFLTDLKGGKLSGFPKPPLSALYTVQDITLGTEMGGCPGGASSIEPNTKGGGTPHPRRHPNCMHLGAWNPEMAGAARHRT